MKNYLFAIVAVVVLLQGCAAQVPAGLQEPVSTSVVLPAISTAKTESPASPIAPSPSVSASPEQKSATGIYQGQADNNFIEIRITGQPEDTAYMVFMLTGDIKDSFDSLKLKKEDAVLIQYYKNDAGQQVLTGIEKLKNS